MSQSSRSQTPGSARTSREAIETCGEKCANLCRVYKQIMISRVPGYGHLEYPELDIIVDLITLNLIELGLMMILNWGLSWGNLLKYCSTWE